MRWNRSTAHPSDATVCIRATSLVGALTACLVPSITHSQEALERDQRPVGEIEEVIATGSRIRGVQATGSNVVSLDREAIASVPTATTTELLRTIPQNIALGTVEAVGGGGLEATSNPFRSNGVNLRGLGGTATLTLIDGYRSVVMGSFGNYVDPSGVPTLGLQSVEVVADGASAIYGSDAVAGVVNLITRKRFQGVEAIARYGVADSGYDEYQIGAIGGVNWDRSYLTISFEHQQKDALPASGRRSFITADQRLFGGQDFRSTQCNPGNIREDTTYFPLPAASGAVTAGQPNRCEPYLFLVPSVERNSTLINAGVDITDNIEFFARGYATEREATVLDRQIATVTVPSTNPFFVAPTPGATAAVVEYDFTEEFGYRTQFAAEHAYHVLAGIRAPLFGGWSGEFALNLGSSESTVDRLVDTNQAALTAAAADMDPATALNVFESGLVNNPDTLASVFSGVFLIQGDNDLRALNFQLDGTLFATGGGDVQLAFGGEHRREKNSASPAFGTRDNVLPLSPFSATRNVRSLFAEMYVPLISGQNARPGVQELSLSLAGRWEEYSDVGETTNPKLAFVWAPIESVRVQGSFGESFRAPYLPESTFRASGFGAYAALNVPDPLSPTGFSSGFSIAGGNDDLKPATAETWSIGLDITPSSLPGLHANLYYFEIDYEDQVFSLQGNPLVLSNPAYEPFIIRNPTEAQIQEYLSFDGGPLPIVGSLPPTIDFILDARRQNLGRTKMSGVDFQVGYTWATDLGDFVADLNGTHMFETEEAVAPGAAFTDVLDTINSPISLRLRAGFGWSRGAWSAHVFGTHVGDYRNANAGNYPIGSYTVFDTRVSRSFDLIGEQTELSLTLNNVFDTDPPHTNTQLGYDPHNANAMGRLVSLSVRQQF